MSAPLLLAVGLLGGAGAIARFLLDGSVSGRVGRAFPYGTLAVNLTGAFALGVMVGVPLGHDAARIAGTGFVGAYTTFSTWMFESHRLGEDGRLRLGVLNIGASLVAGVLCAWAGRHVGMLL